MKIERRQAYWKEKTYRTVENGEGWKIERPTEIKPLEDLLGGFFRRKKKWE